ncbi:alpha/beta hydrolase [Gallaecimonas sp. GXIMD4217]|uniref:alpha/beta fold hydrolase n=1 Tax=Gallaecimonas sp. GXIMD4217 TaxID=3131927 RepID=UPI00311B261D
MARRLFLMALVLALLATLASYFHYRQFKADTYAKWTSESRLAKTPLGPVEYLSKGRGPALLQFHGTPSSYRGNLNFPFYDALFQRYRLISASRPGYLRTPVETGRTPAQQADAFAALVQQLALDKVVVVGISGGGPAALSFARQHGDKCAALVLIEALAKQPAQGLAGSGSGFYTRLLRTVLDNNFVMWLLSDRILAQLFPTLPERQQRAMSADFAEYLSLFSHFRDGLFNDARQFGTLATPDLAGIRCPTLVLHGTSDEVVPFDHAQLVGQGIPGAILVPFEGKGHDMLYTEADAIMAEIDRFLSRLPPAP